jgi:hypothetical protein
MKRASVVIILFCIFVQVSLGQDLWRRTRYEALAGIGSTQFFGDVGGFSRGKNILGFKDFSFSQTRYNFFIGLKYRILEDLNVRVNLAYGKLHANDSRGSNEGRGYEASTSILEPSVIAEYYFITSKLGESYLFNSGKKSYAGNLASALEFYTFLGIGGISYNVDRNAKLEALGMQHQGFCPVIPVGVGATLLFKPQYNFGIELGGRYAFSDYLDGFTSQHSSSNDVYYFLNVTFTYKIRTNDNGLPSFLSKRKY